MTRQIRLSRVRLMRRHVWLRTVPNGTRGQMPVAIVFGNVEPFPSPGRPRPVRITTRMLAWLKVIRLTQRGHWLVFADSISALLGVKAQRQHSPEHHLKRDREILARRGLL